jgi:hypothetical protein
VTASTVFTLAQKTGWTIDYILWEVPISLMSQANHNFLYMMNIKTRRAGVVKAKQVEDLAKLLGV